jgi:hypothetical protein
LAIIFNICNIFLYFYNFFQKKVYIKQKQCRRNENLVLAEGLVELAANPLMAFATDRAPRSFGLPRLLGNAAYPAVAADVALPESNIIIVF